jgi:hypothetical protein
MVEAMRRDWLLECGIGHVSTYLIDTKPLPVVGYKRSKSRSYFAESADYGYCASRKLHYFGYKLVMITTLEGISVVYDLVSANTDERQAAKAVLDRIASADIIGDKGFLGVEWQAQIQEQTGNTVITPQRKNQKDNTLKALSDCSIMFENVLKGFFMSCRIRDVTLSAGWQKPLMGLPRASLPKLPLICSSTFCVLVSKSMSKPFNALPISVFNFT